MAGVGSGISLGFVLPSGRWYGSTPIQRCVTLKRAGGVGTTFDERSALPLDE